MAYRKIDEATKAAVLAAYNGEGMQVRDIAKRFGVSLGTIYGIVDKAGVETRADPATDAQKAEMVRRYTVGGESSPSIAKRMGFSPMGVRKILKSMGVEIVAGQKIRAFDDEKEQKFIDRVAEVGVPRAASEFGISHQGGYKILRRNAR